jgi:hypothetical protein
VIAGRNYSVSANARKKVRFVGKPHVFTEEVIAGKTWKNGVLDTEGEPK